VLVRSDALPTSCKFIKLLDNGINSNTENIRGETPLHLVSRGQYDTQERGVGVVHLLLERGANVDAQDKGHITPLHLASYYGKLEIVRVLLHHGASVNTKGNLGQTSSHLALDGNRSCKDGVGIVRLLLQHGADMNAQDGNGDTPLHWHPTMGSSQLDGCCLSMVQMLTQRTSGVGPRCICCYYGHGPSKMRMILYERYWLAARTSTHETRTVKHRCIRHTALIGSISRNVFSLEQIKTRRTTRERPRYSSRLYQRRRNETSSDHAAICVVKNDPEHLRDYCTLWVY
jgi:hypothetical protein